MISSYSRSRVSPETVKSDYKEYIRDNIETLSFDDKSFNAIRENCYTKGYSSVPKVKQIKKQIFKAQNDSTLLKFHFNNFKVNFASESKPLATLVRRITGRSKGLWFGSREKHVMNLLKDKIKSDFEAKLNNPERPFYIEDTCLKDYHVEELVFNYCGYSQPPFDSENVRKKAKKVSDIDEVKKIAKKVLEKEFESRTEALVEKAVRIPNMS